MADLSVDTVKLKEIGDAIVDDCQALVNIFDNYYSMLLSIRSDSWTGESANVFCRKVLSQRQQYNNYFKGLSRFGDFFVKISTIYTNYTNIYRVKKDD